MEAQREMAVFFSSLIAERRAEPRDDLISHLIAAEIDGQRLTAMELIGFCVLLLVAGNETTTNLLGNAILCFDEQPEVYERLRAQPDLIPGAIEEVLRYRSPVQSMFRSATGETDLGGVLTRAGQPVVAWIGSANRDEARFPDARRLRYHARAQPASRLRLRHPLLPRRAARPPGGAPRPRSANDPFPRHPPHPRRAHPLDGKLDCLRRQEPSHYLHAILIWAYAPTWAISE